VLEVPVKEGFTFKGWYDNLEFIGTPITKITTIDTGNLTLYAKWEKIIIFDFHEDFEDTNLTTSYLDGSFEGEDGIIFTYGHSRDQENAVIDGKGIMLRRASDSYLEFVLPKGFTVLYFEYRRAFTGVSERELEVYVNNIVVGYSVKFGSDDTIYQFIYEPEFPVYGPATIKIKNVGSDSANKQITIDNIKWNEHEAKESYLVSFDTDGGSPVNSQIVLDGEKVVEPAEPVKGGYEFVEWQLDGVAYDFDDEVTEAITLVAIWQKVTVEEPTEFIIVPVGGGNMAEETNYAGQFLLDPEIFSITVENNVSNGVGLYTEFRLYGSSATGEGNKLIIEVDSDYVITEIKINFGASTNEHAAEVIVGETTYNLDDTETKNVTAIYDELLVNMFSIQNVGIGGSSNPQVRINSIEVTIEPA
ncbi:MAG TPA: InlB B-repeat-containing protein, partial [Mollicutes bacterium]|nr:InlB B-repeat-containing protein [Mollicutes bacterium]